MRFYFSYTKTENPGLGDLSSSDASLSSTRIREETEQRTSVDDGTAAELRRVYDGGIEPGQRTAADDGTAAELRRVYCIMME